MLTITRLLLSAIGLASSLVPNTGAGHALAAWIAAFDSGDRTQIASFAKAYTERPDIDAFVQREYALSQSTGGFYLRKITASTPTSITALVQEGASDDFFSVRLTMKDAGSTIIVKRSIAPTLRPAEFALPHLSQSALIDATKARVQREIAADRFSGALLVAKDGKAVATGAYGLADRANHIANTIDTKFRLGSMNKMFTAVAIMQLVQAGKVALDAPFGAYLTGYPNKSVSSVVTVRQLLNHTGGTGDIFTPEYDRARMKLRTLQDYVDLFGSRSLEFAPGTKWAYSNYGYILLGSIIEKVSGENYYDYVHTHIFEPAGMNDTASEPEDEADPRRSIGYTKFHGAWIPNTDGLPYRGTSAGGGYSTVGDLLRFANALQSDRLLDAAHVRLLQTGTIDTPIGKDALGFFVQTVNGTTCIGHDGGAPGMNGGLWICPNSGYTVVVLANEDPPVAGRIADFVLNRLPVGSH